MTNTPETKFHCGYVAIVGRPNVGKSTLLNRILGQKISITAPKPQTTRHRIVGIKTSEQVQAIYVDTPGLHRSRERAMNRYLNRTASSSMDQVDVIVFVVDAARWTSEDDMVLERVRQTGFPVILAVNKVDEVADKEALLPLLQTLGGKMSFASVLPISARKGVNIDALESEVEKLLPVAEACFPEDQVTDRSERFLAAEIIREKLMRQLGAEVPYSLTVEIEKFVQEGGLIHICGLIWVERDGQKAIVIGKKGEQLKRVGQKAREDMEKMFDSKVFLELWVKVKSGWSDDERALRSLGYDENR